MTKTCFVAQPFDEGGPFDKRYDDIIAPAIINAGLNPYRVDRDPGVIIPIEEIENGIRTSFAFVADITLDNPNVWYEVGYARAANKPLILLSSSQRIKFPFDIQHRNILRYKTDSTRDFDDFKNQLTQRLKILHERATSFINDEIRKSRALETAALVLKTPYKDISLVEEILMQLKNSHQIDSKAIGARRNLTESTIVNIIHNMKAEGVLEITKSGLQLTEIGKDMLGVITVHLRPNSAN